MSDKNPVPPCNCVACIMRRAAEQARLDAPRAPTATVHALEVALRAAAPILSPLELENDGGGYDPYNTAVRRLGAAIVAKAVRR